MKHLLLIAITLFALAGCKKEEITKDNPPSISSIAGNWRLTEQVPGQTTRVNTISLSRDLSVTGGDWSLTGVTFTMTRYGYHYTGTVTSTGITGNISPSGTFAMVRP